MILLGNLKLILIISINITLKISNTGKTMFLWENQFRIYLEMLGIRFSCVRHDNIIRNLACDTHWA